MPLGTTGWIVARFSYVYFYMQGGPINQVHLCHSMSMGRKPSESRETEESTKILIVTSLGLGTFSSFLGGEQPIIKTFSSKNKKKTLKVLNVVGQFLQSHKKQLDILYF